MTEEKLKIWTKNEDNVQRVVEGFFASQTKVAFFMAGIPGSGKTEYVEELKTGIS